MSQDRSKRRSRRLSAVRAAASIVVIAAMPAAFARGSHMGAHGGTGHAHFTGGRHGNDAYVAAASAERNDLLRKLKSICKGC